MESTDGPSPFAKQSIVVRVWSEHADLCFRKDWDSRTVARRLKQRDAPRRVMYRVRFDRALPGADEPAFHLQIGGLVHDEAKELDWHPTGLSLPRIPMPPMDLVLAAEIIVANFFPEFYSRKRQEGQWRGLVKRAEEFVSRHYQVCHGHCTQRSSIDETLLQRLWNA